MKDNNEHKLLLTINGKQFEWYQQYITGAETKRLGNISHEEDLFLAVKKPWEDEPILDDAKVNLARPEIEHFYSKEKHAKVILIVNLKEKPWAQEKISFEQVIQLAYGSYDPKPEKGYTVTYDRGPHQNPEGSMVAGNSVYVKNKMIFHVKQTDRS